MSIFAGLPKLFVALDDSQLHEVLIRASKIADVEGDFGFKVNLDAMFADEAVDALACVQAFGKPVFADLKMYNGARTMTEMVKVVASAGAVMTNIFAGNAAKLLEKTAEAAEETGIFLFGIGPLTHMTPEDCHGVYGCSFEEATIRLGERAAQAGMSGYICPGTMNAEASELGLSILNPAVRPTWFEDKKANYQEQTVTPTEAFATGASIVVCGSPIFKSPDPAEALARILQEINEVAT